MDPNVPEFVVGFVMGAFLISLVAELSGDDCYTKEVQEYRIVPALGGYWWVEHRPIRRWRQKPWKTDSSQCFATQAAAEEAAARMSLGPKYLGVFRPHEETKA